MRSRGGDAWELRIYRGVDDTGRQRWSTKTVHGSRRYAAVQLREFSDAVDEASTRAGTVGDLLERWFAAASPQWASPTVAQTRSVLRRHLLPNLGHLPVSKLTTADIDDFCGYLLRCGGHDGRPLSAGTVHRIHVVLYRALAQALRWDWVWINPATNAKPPKYRPVDVRPPSPEQVAVLLHSVESLDAPFAAFLRLAATTGARRSQLLALRWADVDLEHGCLSFTRALVEGPNGPVLAPTKTGRTYRVELDEASLRVVEAHRPSGLTRDAFVFAHPDGRPWLPNHVTKRLIAARTAAGLPRFRLHDLRHFMATQMLAAGVPIATVAQRLSHARASTTLNVYAHAVPGGDRAAAETIAAIVGRARHTTAAEGAPPTVDADSADSR
jgi:integrase